MNEESRSALKAYFETDDIPTETQYQNLIDSLTNRTDDYKTLTSTPTTTEDSDSGYKIFDIAKVTSDSCFYMCFDNTVGAAVWKNISSESTPSSDPDFSVEFPAGSFDYPSTNYAPWDKDSGINGDIMRQLFDDTTEEFVLAQFVLPDSISGTVTFEAWGYPSTWVTGKNIELKFYHSAKGNGESWNYAFVSVESGDFAINTTGQDVQDKFTWTETIANLGWSAGDHVRFKLSRIAPSSDNLSGDWGWTNFKIKVPA